LLKEHSTLGVIIEIDKTSVGGPGLAALIVPI